MRRTGLRGRAYKITITEGPDGEGTFDHLVATFPGATEVVVMGESAGSVGAPLCGGLVSDRLPDARITALAESMPTRPRSKAPA